MTIPNFTAEDLKKLPLRAIVALAVRCARRVEKRALLPDDRAGADECRQAVSDALAMAEDFSRGMPCTSADEVIHKIESCQKSAHGDPVRENAIAAAVQAAYAAAAALNAANVRSEPAVRHLLGPTPELGPQGRLGSLTADVAALSAFTAAVDAADAAGYSGSFIQSAISDYRAVLSQHLGEYPDAGRPIDPSPDGPLGPLLPE